MVNDASGDATGGIRQLDVLSVSIAEPYSADEIERIVFTMKLADANPDSLPPNSLWRVSFVADTSPSDTTFFVSMNTCDPDVIPGYAFDYGYVDVNTQNLNRGLGVPESGVLLPNGEVRITMRKTTVGNSGLGPVAFHIPVGTALSGISATSFVFAGAACSGVINEIDTTPGSPIYDVEGSNFCKPHTVSCPDDFTGDADDGEIPLSFSFTNPSTTERRFEVVLSDANGWLVGGPVDFSVSVASGGTETVDAALQMTADCTPADMDEITWVVTASDLPSPDDVKECSTVATCEPITTTVLAESAVPFSFGLLGSNPFRGETDLSYSLPERRRVKIEVYSVTGSLVRTLVDSEHGPGSFTVPFRLRDAAGRRLSSGVYLVRITAGKDVRNLRLVGLD